MNSSRILFLFGLFLFLLVTGGTSATLADSRNGSQVSGATTEKFVAVLVADVHEGKAVETTASGRANFEVVEDGSGLAYTITVSGLEAPYMAHLRLGKSMDHQGSLVVWLWPADRKPVEGKKELHDGLLASGVIRANDLTGVLAKKKMTDLLAAIRGGKVDADIHTRRHMPGELRGLLVKAE
ncbi:MAG: CHRD domain-containing protein [Desulfurivibrionaceae bacterium]